MVNTLSRSIFKRLAVCAAFGAFSIVFSNTAALASETVDAIKARGHVLCSTAGFLNIAQGDEPSGTIAGFDRDFCRAIAAAVLGDKDLVKLVHLVPSTRFGALQSGAVDVLVRSTTWTLSRDGAMGLHFAAVNFYDGQGFIAHKSLGIKKLSELKGRSKNTVACVEKNTTSQDNLADLIKDLGLPIVTMPFNAFEELRYAFFNGRCAIYTSDMTFLTEFRLSKAMTSDDYVILDDVVSKEPLSAVVRDTDAGWFNIVRWIVHATIQAEELGITSANVDRLVVEGTVAQKKFLGGQPGVGEALGLDDKWAYRIVKQVGSYAEIFDRNLGQGSPYKLDRGLNALWTNGGLMYSPPFH